MVLSYNEVGVYLESGTGEQLLPVSNARLSLSSTVVPQRNHNGFVGEWGHSDKLDINLSIGGVLNFENATILNGYSGLTSGFYLNLGGLKIKNAHLRRVQYTLRMFEPVSFSADFVAYDLEGSPTGKSGYDTNLVMDTVSAGEVAHGLFSDVSGFVSGYYPENPFEISVSIDMERLPRYRIGDVQPEKTRIGNIEKNVSIAGTNWSDFISFSGANGTGSIHFGVNNAAWGLGYSDNGLVSGHAFIGEIGYLEILKLITSSGRIISQELTITDNGVLEGSIALRETIR